MRANVAFEGPLPEECGYSRREAEEKRVKPSYSY